MMDNPLHPAWSPDGQQIAFSAGETDIYVVDKDGSNLINLTNHPAFDYRPHWR